jgi:hypothetical protein
MQSNLRKALQSSIKFIVLVDARTDEELAVYFNHLLPDMHRELLKEAVKRWAKLGISLLCHGGGRITLKDHTVILYGKSMDFGRFDEDEALRLIREHPAFKDGNYRFIAKSGADSPAEVLNHYQDSSPR